MRFFLKKLLLEVTSTTFRFREVEQLGVYSCYWILLY